MHPPISEEQWKGMREMRSLLPPTLSRVAEAGGVHPSTVRERAARENWPKLLIPKGAIMRIVTPKELRDETTLRAKVEALAAANDPGARDADAIELAASTSPGDMGARIVETLQKTLADMQFGLIDKGRVDALLTMVRVAERIDKLKLVTIQPEQKRSDEELAGILALIDRRIVELARDYAERLGARQYHA